MAAEFGWNQSRERARHFTLQFLIERTILNYFEAQFTKVKLLPEVLDGFRA